METAGDRPDPREIGVVLDLVSIDRVLDEQVDARLQQGNELARDPVVWWNLMAASSALFGLILAVNLVGDAIRDILDPRTLQENL